MKNEESLSVLYAPTLIIAFISATFGFLNFTSSCLELDGQSLFSIGIMRVILGILFFICSIIQILKGEIYGNINMIFSIIFGFFSGTNQIVAESESLSYALIQPEIFAVIQIMAGWYLGLVLPTMRKLPFYQWLTYMTMAVILNLLGLGTIFDIIELQYFAGLLNILFSVLSIYIGLRAIEEKLPKGKIAHQILYEREYETHEHKEHKHQFSNLLLDPEEDEELRD